MPPRRRLNLFAFPPETNALFSMLILASVTLTLFSGKVFGAIFRIPGSIADVENSARGLEVTAAYLPGVLLSIVFLLALLGLALIFYLRHPSGVRQLRQLSSISEKDQEIQRRVNDLSLQAGVEPPEIEMPAQGLRGTDAQAFGVGKEQRIGLDGGFRILWKTKPDIFRAFLHHELAHFANGDIARSYFSDALWKSLRWIVVLPFAIGIIGDLANDFFRFILYGNFQVFVELAQSRFPLLLQFSLILFVAAVLWARLLRAREFYADWRAVLWGSRGGLKKIFDEEVGMEKPKAQPKLFAFHPNAKERIEAIEQPETLFELSPVIIFLTGVMLSFMLAGIYFALASFLTFAGVLQAIRDASAGLVYWIVRGIFWAGIILLFLMVIGLTGWLINGVLLPQIQKQTVLEAISKQRGVSPYLKLFVAAVLLIAGIEIGFFMTPFSQFSPKNLWGFMLEIFVVAPILVIISWWYFAYMRFISLRLSTTQTGRNFSVWRKRFIHTASVLWVFFFFMPGLLLSRYLTGDLAEGFLYSIVIWLIFTILFSLAMFGGSWALMKLFFDNQPKKCPHCGKITKHSAPAIESCEHCEGILGEWLFVPEKI